MTEIRPRVTGTEMEWAVGLRYSRGNRYKQAISEISDIVQFVGQRALASSPMLTNGSKCYRDTDALEYATGEDDSFRGTVANEIAGEQLVREGIEKYIDSRNSIYGFQLQKRVYYDQQTMGYHINLCADATKVSMTAESLHDLGLWAATAAMYTGAGCLYEDGEYPARFAIAQKASRVRCGFGVSTITRNSKPLVCLRNEPLGDPDKFHRIQIVGLDPNISPWASWMNLGVASLCLRAIEQNRTTGRSLYLKQPEQQMDPMGLLARNVAFNPKLNSVARLEDGRVISAIGIQEMLYEQASRTEHTEEEAEVLKNWKMVLDDLNGDHTFITKKAGWPLRLKQYQKDSREIEDKQTLLARDRAWDSLVGKNMAETLRSSLWQGDMPPAELIADRRENPCPNTRAVLRSKMLRENVGRSGVVVDWSYYQLERGGQKTILKDPLMTTLPPLDQMDQKYKEPDEEEDEAGFY